MNNSAELRIEEKVTNSQGAILGLQHVLLMNAYVVPVIIASILAFAPEQSSALIQSTFLASGITILLQATVFMKYPVVYGASFVPVSAIIGIYMMNGNNPAAWDTVVGACLVGAIVPCVLGLSKQFKKILDYLFPPLVGAIVVLTIGISLIPLALQSQIFAPSNISFGGNIVVAFVTMLTMVIFSLLGSKAGFVGSFCRIGSGILALLAGTITSSFYTNLDFTAMNQQALISMPALPFLDFGISFDMSSILTMIILYLVMMTETTGTWFATSSTTNTELTEKRVNNGVLGLGISNIIAALLGTTPMSGYSSNVGVLAITNNHSRHVFKFVGGILIVIGFSGKLSAMIAVVPAAAIGGVFAMTSGIIAVAGIQILKGIEIGMREMYIIAISIIMAIGLNILPTGSLEVLPTVVQYILGSSIASTAIVAVILNKTIPSK